MHLHDHLGLLRSTDMDSTYHRLHRSTRCFWKRFGDRHLDTHVTVHLFRRPSTSMCLQRCQSSTGTQPPGGPSIPRVDAYACLRGRNRNLALLALLHSNAREQAGTLLPHHVLRLWAYDNQDNTGTPDEATIPLLDRHACPSGRRGYLGQPATRRLACCRHTS